MTKYTTIAGDMWDGIAYKTLGDEAYTDRLMKLNPQYRRTFVLVILTTGMDVYIRWRELPPILRFPRWNHADSPRAGNTGFL